MKDDGARKRRNALNAEPTNRQEREEARQETSLSRQVPISLLTLKYVDDETKASLSVKTVFTWIMPILVMLVAIPFHLSWGMTHDALNATKVKRRSLPAALVPHGW